MRLGLIGLGQISKEHLKAISKSKDFELAAVCDIDPDRKPHKSVEFYTDYKDLLRDETIEAVVVATPHNSHASITIDSLVHGKNVLVEKPIAINIKDAQKMIDTASSVGKALVVSNHYQCVPEVQYFLKHMKEYGKIKSFSVDFSANIYDILASNRPWLFKKEMGGGIWLDNGVNVLGVLRLFLPNLKVKDARFHRVKDIPPDVIQNPDADGFAQVNLRDGNTEGFAVVDWYSQTGFTYRTTFHTEKGHVFLDHTNHRVTLDKSTLEKEIKPRIIFEGREKRYSIVYRNFINSIKEGKSNAPEALQDLKLVMDAYAFLR